MYPVKNLLSRDKIKSDLEAFSQDTDSLDNLATLAARYVITKDYELALDKLDTILELYEPTSQLYLNRALCLYRMGQIKDSISSLEESLTLDADNQDSLKLKLMLEQMIERLRKYTMDPYS